MKPTIAGMNEDLISIIALTIIKNLSSKSSIEV